MANGTLQEEADLDGDRIHSVEKTYFLATPTGSFSIMSTAWQGPFAIDFVFYKLWPFLLGVIALSGGVAFITFRFIRNRYDEVAHERARLGDFALSSSDWYWEMDEKLRFSYFSPVFTSVTGVPQSVLLGVTREENGNPGAAKEDWEKHLKDLREHRVFKDFVHPRTKPDGTVVWLSINGRPIFENGKFKGFRGTGRDISHRRAIEKQLISTKEEAERANQAKSEFLANMSHELRTPLNAIIGFSELLMHETFGPVGDPKNRDSLTSIHEAGNHLFAIISDILDISKIEANVLEIDDEVFDVVKVATETVRMVLPSAQEKGVSLKADFQDEFPKITADRLRVKQVLLNLINNGIKFTPSGGEVVVVMKVEANDGVVISVTDTGIGIAEENIHKIIEPFGQVADSQKRSHGGTGLGLSICKSLMELHGGNMIIESELGKGSRFVVRFPPERTCQPEL